MFALAVCSWFHFMNMVWTTADFRHSFVLRCSHWSLAVLRGRREQSQAVTLFKFSLRIQCCSNRSRAVSNIVSGSRAVQTLSLGAGLFKHGLFEQGCSNITSVNKAVQTHSLGPGLFKPKAAQHSLWEHGYSDLASGTRLFKVELPDVPPKILLCSVAKEPDNLLH